MIKHLALRFGRERASISDQLRGGGGARRNTNVINSGTRTKFLPSKMGKGI